MENSCETDGISLEERREDIKSLVAFMLDRENVFLFLSFFNIPSLAKRNRGESHRKKGLSLNCFLNVLEFE